IEKINKEFRIKDHKTGKEEQNQYKIDDITGTTEDMKYEKAIQLLMNGVVYQNNTHLSYQDIIYSFKYRKSGYLLFSLKDDKSQDTFITANLLSDFRVELVHLLTEILHPELNFEEKEV